MLPITLALSIGLQSATPEFAWGRLGHRVISRLAKMHMTDKARDARAELLEPNETIADAPTWADEYPFPTAAAARSAGPTSGVSRNVYVMAAASLTKPTNSKPES